jgi:hypothetical protein
LLVFLALLTTVLAGCSTSSPLVGIFYTEIEHGTNVGEGHLTTPKEGKACAQSVLGLVAFGDASIETAKKEGGVRAIAFVDHESMNIWFFYARYCTIVKGQ